MSAFTVSNPAGLRTHESSYWQIMIGGSDPVPHVEELQRWALQFREYHALPKDCGNVLFHLGKPFRWSVNGTNVADVVPGVISITHDNYVHVATGGDHDAGAEEWKILYAPSVTALESAKRAEQFGRVVRVTR